jgi:hypothetical protein
MKIRLLSAFLLILACCGAVHAQADPAWIRFCDRQEAANVFCNEKTWQARAGLRVAAATAIATPTAAYTAPAWGQSGAAITAAFPGNMAKAAATNPGFAAQLNNCGPLIPRMSSEMLATDHAGYTGQMLASAARVASAANLQMLQMAFGNTLMAQAIVYAPAAIQAQYRALPAMSVVPLSALYWTQKGMISPLAGNQPYLMQLAIEICFSGADSSAGALQKASHFSANVLDSGKLDVFVTKRSIKQLPMPGPVASWVAIVIGVTAAFCPNCGPDFLTYLNNLGTSIGSDLAPYWSPFPNGQVIGPGVPFGGGYPGGTGPSFPTDPGNGDEYPPCNEGDCVFD